MVRVQIPFDAPTGNDGGENSDGEEEEEVGIMSDSDPESEVDDDIGDPDWDEVKNKDEFVHLQPVHLSSLPKEGVTIQLGEVKRRPRRRGPKRGSDDEDEFEELSVPKKKKKRMDLNEYVRRTVNRVKITEQLMKHKLSLLLYMGRGLRLVKIINNNIIQGLSLSITENKIKIKGKRLNDYKWLQEFLNQFGDLVQISSDEDKREVHMNQPFMVNMLDCYSTLEVTSLMELVVMFVACLKAVKSDMPVRIINVLRPVTLRADIIPKPPSPANSESSTKLPTDTNGASEKNLTNVENKDFTMFDIKTKSQARNSTTKKKALKPKEEQKIEVIDIEDEHNGLMEKLDFWVEVYIESEKRWCCVDLCNLKLDEPNVLVELSQPFSYLVSYDVDRLCIKAAEKNYCQNWYTRGFKQNRCDDKWWDSLIGAMGPAKLTEKDVADEAKTDQILVNTEMPTSDNGFRNHPLYVLEKHLLKFQGIYPPEVAPLGFFRDQPVYPRACVHTLRSRETWLRQARTVKLNETPYKITKARPKRVRNSTELIRDLPLELFGEWQTKDYEPPEAVGGKVPRNCYGNVDMYQECMLPIGCKWLKLPGLPRVANKLGIDCVPAVVGFDNHPGSYGAHPVMDGFIVCDEHVETLQMAWDEEQENIRIREENKRQKRIWDNWRRLIKAAQIRERISVKYKNS